MLSLVIRDGFTAWPVTTAGCPSLLLVDVDDAVRTPPREGART